MGCRSTDFAGRGSSRGREEGSFAEGLAHQMVAVVRHPGEVVAKTGRLKVGGQCFLGVVGKQEDF
jgi:hypothetical protein